MASHRDPDRRADGEHRLVWAVQGGAHPSLAPFGLVERTDDDAASAHRRHRVDPRRHPSQYVRSSWGDDRPAARAVQRRPHRDLVDTVRRLPCCGDPSIPHRSREDPQSVTRFPAGPAYEAGGEWVVLKTGIAL